MSPAPPISAYYKYGTVIVLNVKMYYSQKTIKNKTDK